VKCEFWYFFPKNAHFLICEPQNFVSRRHLASDRVANRSKPSHDNRISKTTMTAVTEMEWSFGALMFLSTLTIGLRIFVKHRRGRPIRKDDYTLAAAWVRVFCSLPSSRHLPQPQPHSPECGGTEF
jgi:hypothetical protein